MDARQDLPLLPHAEENPRNDVANALAGKRSRRNLFRLAAGAPPVLVAMSSRPAWAGGGGLSPSAYCSIHPGGNTNVTLTTSQTPSQTTGGCGHSATTWGNCYQNQSSWCHGIGNFSCPTNPTTFRTACGKGSYGSNCSFGQLLCDSTYSPSSPYDRDFCAAYLSACNRGSTQVCAGYPLTTTDVQNMYCGTYKSCGVTWTRTQCHTYILSLCNDGQAAGQPNCGGGWSSWYN